MARKSGESWSESGTWHASGYAVTHVARVVVVDDGAEDVSVINDGGAVDELGGDDDSVRDTSGDDSSDDETSDPDARLEDTSVDKSSDGETSVDKSNVDEFIVESVIENSSAVVVNVEVSSVGTSELHTARSDTDAPPAACTGAGVHLPLGQTGTSR